MEIYKEIQSFKCDKEMKKFLLQLKKNKVNVSKFIRVAIEEKMQRDNLVLKIDKRKKPTINDLRKSLTIFEETLQKEL
jgi:hypothetical protein